MQAFLNDTKINSYIVAAIRNSKGLSYQKLADKYGVSKTLIAKILREEIWKN